MTTIFPILLLIAIGISASLFFTLVYNLRRQRKDASLLSEYKNTESDTDVLTASHKVIGSRTMKSQNRKRLLAEETVGY